MHACVVRAVAARRCVREFSLPRARQGRFDLVRSAHGMARAARSAESLAADSRGFDRIRLLSRRPRGICGKKIFGLGKCDTRRNFSAAKRRRGGVFAIKCGLELNSTKRAKSQIPSRFSRSAEFSLAHSSSRALVRRERARCAPISVLVGRYRRARTRSVKWSRCFFRRAGVIGMQCTSIRGGTVPTSPHIVARRAAMAKKRKAKKVAKKAAKRRKKK